MDTTKRILGINDDHDACCQCGRTGLKRVVWIEHEDGTVEHYGTVCAAYIMKGSKSETAQKQIIETANAVQSRRERFNANAVKFASPDRKTAAWSCRLRNKGYDGTFTFLTSDHGHYAVPADCIEQIQALTDSGWTVTD